MKKNLLFILSTLLLFSSGRLLSQCITATTAVADVTLQCSGGTTNRTGVAFNPLQNLYYSVDAGNPSYPIETFSVTGGTSLNSAGQGADYRGYWWNPSTGAPEGNTYNSGGIYTNTLTTSGYATGSATLAGSATMPNAQSCGAADIAGNRMIYYDSGTLYLYSKSSNTLISSSSISGLPSSNINVYTVGFTGVPGSEVVLYNYSAKAAYFINISTAAYTSSCSLPSNAPAASTYQMGFANSRLFLFDGTNNAWYGYKILAGIPVSASYMAVCTGSTTTLTASGASTYTWSNGANTATTAVSPTVVTVYSVQATYTNGCVASNQLAVTVNSVAPSLSVVSSTPQTCNGHTVTLTASGALTYTWSNGVTNGAVFTATATNTYTISGQNGCGTTTAVATISVAPIPLAASASQTTVCSGSSTTLSAVSTATTYTWTSSASSLSTTIVSPTATTVYTVTGSDGMCLGSATVMVSTNPLPSMSIAASNTMICDGDAVTLNVTGNASTYTWNPGGQTGTSISVSPTTTALYSVSGINSFNCSSSAQQVVLVNPLPTVNASVSDLVVCAGGPSTLTASGANTYVWSTGDNSSVAIVQPTAFSTYSVTGTNTNNCSSTATVSVNVFIPNISVSNNASICIGGNVVISASGADSYTWTNSGSNLSGITVTPTLSTTYTVMGAVTDPNSNVVCDATNTVQVTVNTSPNVTASASHGTICIGTSAILTAGGADSYTWTGGSGAVTSESMMVSPISNQTYSVSGVDANGCKGTAALSIQVAPCTGITNISASATSISIYPNPNNGAFTIETTEAAELAIYNQLGQVIQQLHLNSQNNYNLKVEGLSSGVYFISIQGNNSTDIKKIVVQN